MTESTSKPETALQKVKRHLKIAGPEPETVIRRKLQRAFDRLNPPIALSIRGDKPYEAKWREGAELAFSGFGNTADSAAINAAAELFESPRGAEILAALAGKI
ncbi:MAG: hypothetical protein ABMA13_00075 [Chthoniobacteraceae bacterium]